MLDCCPLIQYDIEEQRDKNSEAIFTQTNVELTRVVQLCPKHIYVNIEVLDTFIFHLCTLSGAMIQKTKGCMCQISYSVLQVGASNLLCYHDYA